MELKLISKDKNSIVIEVIGEESTVLECLVQKLLSDKNVVVATWSRKHPLLDNPKIHLKVKDGKPQSALKKAAKALASEFGETLRLFNEATGK
ncbi:MAG: RpoL/Rpb11 RNA polymerase subunit family protein [Candidatus Thermoplasmatota archaeon]